ncbi:siderophore-interacting protein [Mycobacterium sp. Aquia_216]|uniref:siderophore-interacting protein n=1 Tax=Mycobacterium sp. Aquia_216 TaxID=2991729 RepID=UPI00227A3612|nr:siderophore-interacting protein [Mycobacterium sp. Aquia_216]WAJ44342.1 siderophore-interacting protein [Mycobacterium sp. Aquia_216]
MLKLGSRLSNLISDIVLTPVDVIEVESLASRFTRVRLQSQAFEQQRWATGDKLQFRVRPGSVDLRTYTPINWDAERGTTDLIAFDHGEGPGARWFDRARSGDVCEVFGPSRSIDLSDTASDVVFIGDETSIALAHTLRENNPAARYLFETEDPHSLRSALTALGFPECEIMVKSTDRHALLESARAVGETFSETFDLVVSGDAATVSAVRRANRSWDHLTPRIKARAYWAKGRTGLS